MDFKFKEVVEESIIHFYDHVLLYREYTDDVLDELDHVYAQAAKADEYEAKAKAFDEVLKSYDESLSSGRMADDVCSIIEKYERGKRNAEK